MRRRAAGFGATIMLTLVSTLVPPLAAMLAAPASAQAPGAPAPAPTPIPLARGEEQPARLDAPMRVGRLARIAGTVSFHPEAADRWEPALLNYPVSDGAAFWTEPGAEADIDIGASRVVMDGTTELDIHVIDTLAVQASLPQGTVYLCLRALAAGETWVIQTPRGTVLLHGAGRYGIFAGDMENATRVTVLEGAARLSLGHTDLDLADGQTGVIEGVDDFTARAIPTGPEPFLQAQARRDRPSPPTHTHTPAPPPLPAATTPATTAQQHIATPPTPGQAAALPAPAHVITLPGGAELDPHGSWADAAPYGRVWFPRVAPDWQPFRDGRWVWVRPWGWTWLDDAPWGFATSHFGRWVKVQGRWAWTPGGAAAGEAARPVYVPAMVAFQRGAPTSGTRTGGTRTGGTQTGGTVGWTPLGWGEAYQPWYRHSAGYLRALNPARGGPTRHTTTAHPGLSHHTATLSVPAEAMTNSSRVGTLARPLPGGPATAAGTPPRPSLNTIGMNREEARRLNILLPPPRDTAPIKPPAPGPILFHRLPNPKRANPKRATTLMPAATACPAAGLAGAFCRLAPWIQPALIRIWGQLRGRYRIAASGVAPAGHPPHRPGRY